MPRFDLYEDQQEFIDSIRSAVKHGYKSILGVASPAFGKTVVAADIIESAKQKANASTWFLVHRKNLLRQTSKSFWGAHIEHGLMTSGRAKSRMPVQVGTIGTVFSRLSSLTAPSILFVDEAHLAKGNMFETVIRWALDAGSIVIGLTGTPERLDGKALGDVFETMVEARPTSWLISQGRLSDYIIFSTGIMPHLESVKKSGGDYNREELAVVMDKPKLVGDAISHWKKLCSGMRTVAYCVNVQHSKNTCAAFNAAGVPAVHVDAKTTEAELKDACEGLATGRYLVLCNCELVIEGFDLSSQVGMDITIECCILLRPTQSLARYLQMIFRCLRISDRPSIILDHAGCAMRHGLPDDDREWTLEGRKKRKRKAGEEPALPVQQCQSCYHVFRSGPTHCPNCGAEAKKSRPDIEQEDGELVRIDPKQHRRQRKIEQGKARTLEELVQLGLRRGMNKPAQWAAFVYAQRQGRKPTAHEFAAAKRAINPTYDEGLM